MQRRWSWNWIELNFPLNFWGRSYAAVGRCETEWSIRSDPVRRWSSALLDPSAMVVHGVGFIGHLISQRLTGRSRLDSISQKRLLSLSLLGICWNKTCNSYSNLIDKIKIIIPVVMNLYNYKKCIFNFLMENGSILFIERHDKIIKNHQRGNICVFCGRIFVFPIYYYYYW